MSMSDLVLDGEYGIRAIAGWMSWWVRRRSKVRSMLVVRYEDMLADAAGSLDRVLLFITGSKCSSKIISQAVEASSFERMRHKEAVSGRLMGMHPAVPGMPQTAHVRSGKSGAWKSWPIGLRRLVFSWMQGMPDELGLYSGDGP